MRVCRGRLARAAFSGGVARRTFVHGRDDAVPAAFIVCVLGLVAIAFHPATLRSQEVSPDSPGAELDALVSEALVGNPDVMAAAQRFEAAKAMIPPARTLPDPTLTFSYKDMDVNEAMYGVSQEIPFPGKLKLRGEIASREAGAMEQNYLAVRLGVIARLKVAYYELLLSDHSIAIIEKTRQILEQLSAAAEAGYSVGRMAQADVFRAQAEVSRSLARLATARQRKQSVNAELARLLNRPAATTVDVEGQLRPVPTHRNLADTLALIDESPMLRARGAAIERSNAVLALARREYLPDFEIGLQGVHEEPMRDDGYQVMLNVTVPLYFASKQRYGVREALATRESTAGENQALRQELVMRVTDEFAQIDRAGKVIELLEKAIIPQAELTLASARSAYSVGKVDFLTLLNSLFTLQENELELRAEIAGHEQARARLEEIIGEEP
ncbi:MAG: TolC family protein [Gammaproteobacteria bacterium]|nr:MAG: TolC family protein [Gammaproteobacteria bacterium]